MDAIASHFQEYYAYWVIGIILSTPVIFVTRKYSVPVLQYALETAIYTFLMHIAIGTIVRVAAWFKNSSSMRALDDDGIPEGAVDWQTPWIEFWDKAAYNPEWVIYLECVILVLIFAAVARYRPMKVHNPHARKYDDKGKKIGGGKAGAAGARKWSEQRRAAGKRGRR